MLNLLPHANEEEVILTLLRNEYSRIGNGTTDQLLSQKHKAHTKAINRLCEIMPSYPTLAHINNSDTVAEVKEYTSEMLAEFKRTSCDPQHYDLLANQASVVAFNRICELEDETPPAPKRAHVPGRPRGICSLKFAESREEIQEILQEFHSHVSSFPITAHHRDTLERRAYIEATKRFEELMPSVPTLKTLKTATTPQDVSRLAIYLKKRVETLCVNEIQRTELLLELATAERIRIRELKVHQVTWPEFILALSAFTTFCFFVPRMRRFEFSTVTTFIDRWSVFPKLWWMEVSHLIYNHLNGESIARLALKWF